MSHWVLFSAVVLAVMLLACWIVCVIRPELDRILDRMFPEYRPKTLREYFFAVKLVRKRRRWTWPSRWRRMSGAEKDDLEARMQAARLD